MQWNQKQSILEGVMTAWDTSKKQRFYKKYRRKSGIG